MTPSSAPAHISGLFASGGGVPKLPLDRALIDAAGIVGDDQADLENHGGPERALCLYSLERLLALRGEGHPVEPGAMGENILIAGLDWDLVTPATCLRLGNDVLIEVTRYTTPCAKIRGCFRDGKIRRVLQDAHPGWSRVYARVLEGGALSLDAPVSIIGKSSVITVRKPSSPP